MAHNGTTLKTTCRMAVAVVAFLVAAAGAAQAGADASRDVGPKEASALIRENAGNGDFVLLDVRTPAEFAAGHIEGAVPVDYRSSAFREELAGFDRAKTYLVYCRTGSRSARALEILRELGFRSYYHLTGGIDGWLEEGLPAVRRSIP